MQREFRFRLADVDNVLHEFENRGMSFFDDTMRLARVVDLMNKSKMKADFERTGGGRPAAADREAGAPRSSTGWSAPSCGSGRR